MKNTVIPKVKIFNSNLTNNIYTRGNKEWKVTTLIQYIEEQGLTSFDVPLASIPLWDMNFDVSNMDDFIHNCKRVQDADYSKYPIILDDYGQVADGWHRICHAILDGKTTIKAYRLEQMPYEDRIVEDAK